MIHNSRNPSIGDSRYSSSLITIKKPSLKSRLFKYNKNKKSGVTDILSNKSSSSMRKTCTPLYMIRQMQNSSQEKSKNKTSTQDHFKKTISCYDDQAKKSKSKNKRNNSKKKSNQKKDRSKNIKRPSSALGCFKQKNLRSSSNKGKHFRNNESLYYEKFKSKENTIRNDDTASKMKKNKIIRNSSKSYIKINGFDKIVSSLMKKERSKERTKNFSKIDYSINTDIMRYPKSKNLNILSSQYVVLSKGRTPGLSMSTRNLSLDKNDQTSSFQPSNLDASVPFVHNCSTLKNSHNKSYRQENSKGKDFTRNSLIRSKKQPSQKDL